MDRLIKRFDGVDDGDLFICDRGVAYQKDMSTLVKYDEAYFNKCLGYEDKDIAVAINDGRKALVKKYHKGRVLDIGIGSGEFIKKRPDTYGYDINPVGLQWLYDNRYYSDKFRDFNAFTFWDVVEHVDAPEGYFKRFPDGAFVFFSLPIFGDLQSIRGSKHYRPNEHLYYFTSQGFIDWMAMHRFRLLERQKFEIDAGRDSIYSFAFKKDLPSYRDTLNQYKLIHEDRLYGASSKIYLETFVSIIKDLNPTSILDYGCGRSDLLAHFWLDGDRVLERYDPALTEYNVMPEGKIDLVICCDVMEHIPILYVDKILAEIRNKSRRALLVISTIKARARLPDGRNAHVTLLTKPEWTRWVDSVFGKAREVPTQWDHALMLKTF